MNCSKIQREISAYFAKGEKGLPPEVASHLEQCPSCAAFARDLGGLRGVLDRSALAVRPGELDGITFEKIVALASPEAKKRPAPSFGRLLRWSWVPAAVSAIVLLVFLFGRNSVPTDDSAGYAETGLLEYSSQQLLDEIASSDSLGTKFLATMVEDEDDLGRAADELLSGADLDDLLEGLTADELKTLYIRLDDLKG